MELEHGDNNTVAGRVRAGGEFVVDKDAHGGGGEVEERFVEVASHSEYLKED